MKVGEKLSCLNSHALGILLTLRDINVKNVGGADAWGAADHDLRAALYAGGSLLPAETARIAALIAMAKELTGFDSDDDDGQDKESWYDELEQLAPTVEHVLVPATEGLDTRHIEF